MGWFTLRCCGLVYHVKVVGSGVESNEQVFGSGHVGGEDGAIVLLRSVTVLLFSDVEVDRGWGNGRGSSEGLLVQR